MSLNRYQQIVSESYADGDFAWTGDDFRDSGDTLYTFLMIELGDKEGCTNLEMAITRVLQAVHDLQDVLDALEKEKET